MRLRNWLESGAVPAEPVPDDPAGARPVSLARMSIPEQIARVEQVAESATTQLTNAIGELRRQVALVGDDEARAAEIESVRYDEGKKVEEARGAQLAAERGRAQGPPRNRPASKLSRPPRRPTSIIPGEPGAEYPQLSAEIH